MDGLFGHLPAVEAALKAPHMATRESKGAVAVRDCTRKGDWIEWTCVDNTTGKVMPYPFQSYEVLPNVAAELPELHALCSRHLSDACVYFGTAV